MYNVFIIFIILYGPNFMSLTPREISLKSITKVIPQKQTNKVVPVWQNNGKT